MQSAGMSFQPMMFRLPVAPQPLRFPPVQMSVSAPAVPMGQAAALRLGGAVGNAAPGAALLRDQAFAPMREEALTTSLSTMKMPLTKENVALAKTMVQSGVPLTRSNVESLKTSLASLPSVSSSDMQAASFLKSASLPTTSGNITMLSNFISVNPHVGACIFEFNREFKRLCSNGRSSIQGVDMKLLSKTSSLLEGMSMNTKAGSRASAGAFRRMAGSSGMDLPSFMMGTRDEELDSMMLSLRKMLLSGDRLELEALRNAFLKLDDALAAQRLINSGRRDGQENFFYFQIPLVFGDENLTAEFKLYYTTDYKGRKCVDPDNFEFEFSVPSRAIGDVLFKGSVSAGVVSMDVGFENRDVLAFAEKFVACLAERLEGAGFIAGDFSSGVRERGLPMALDAEDFSSMESVDMSF